MRRVLINLLILIAIITLTSSAVYAAISGKIKLNELTFSTGNANLQISRDANNWSQDIGSGIIFENITPGWSKNYEIFVRNTGKTNLVLNLKAERQSNFEDQANLREIIKIRVLELNGENEEIHDFGEKNLGEIQNDSGNEFELGQIHTNENRAFLLQFSVPNELDQKFQNQNLTGFDFVFYGENEY